MHAVVLKPRMTEETFQILLDVMEKRFAALSLPNSSSEQKLTKAISYSELPSSRRILIEQSFQSSSSLDALVRKYSCEQIFDKDSNTRQVRISELVKSGQNECKSLWEATVPCYRTFKTVEWRTNDNKSDKPIELGPTNGQCEYMEVDDIHSKRSGSFITIPRIENKSNRLEMTDKLRCELANKQICSDRKDNDVSLTKSSSNLSTNLNNKAFRTKKGRKLEINKDYTNPIYKSKHKTNKMKFCSLIRVTFLLLLPAIMTVIGVFLNREELAEKFCKRQFNFSNAAATELRERIYGQHDAVEQLIDYFENNSDRFKVMALVGGTGVGKSYAADIVRKNFPYERNIFEYFAPLQISQKHNYEILSFCYCNLIILDHLGPQDLLDAVNFVKSTKTRAKRYCITILTLFNMQVTNDNLERKLDLGKSIMEVETAFRKDNIEAKVIGFEPLSEKPLKDCIEQVARERNLRLSQTDIDYIKQGLLIANSGCKGAYSKIQLIGKT